MDKQTKYTKYVANGNGVLVGNLPRDMFYMTSLGSSTKNYLPNPDQDNGLKFTVATFVDSARNAKAVVTAQKIGRDQIKFELNWTLLSVTEWESLMAFWDQNFFFDFTYTDTSGVSATRKCYISDRKYGYLNITTTGKPTAYVNCSVSIVDTGED